jgi:TP901 family phage tail tape measure protein
MAEKIAYEIEIKNLTQVTKLKEELKKLRKQQKLIEGETKKGAKAGKMAAAQYSKNAKAIGDKSKKLRDLNKELRSSTSATGKVTKSNNSMAKQFIKGAAAIGIVIGAFRAVNRVVGSVVSTFSDFEFVMAKVNAVSGATEQEFSALTATAEELGRTTFFTATQVGELMLNFSKLGFTAQEIQNAVQPTLDLATATGSDLARAATVAGAAVRGFGLDASETERVVDVMAVSFSSSAMNIEKWQTSMTKVAPIAKAAGFSIEDTAAIMSKLTDSGIEASIAGTSLRNILLKMQDPTSELSMRFGKTIHSLDELVPAMKKFVSEGGSMADIMEVVDLRQAAAFEQMITTADGTLELRDALLAANGEGARMAGIVGDTLQGAFLKFTSALQGVAISLMKNYSEGLTDAIEKTAKWLNGIASNIEVLTKALKVIKAVAIAIGLYKVGLLATNVALRIYGTLQASAATATGAFTAATNLATAAMGRLTTALARTGIGAFVIAVGHLVTELLLYNEEASAAIDWTNKFNEEMDNGAGKIDVIEKRYEKLAEAKETINRLTNSEGKLLKDNTKNRELLRKAMFSEKTELTQLNNLGVKHNGTLLTSKTRIDDVKTAIDGLLEKMKGQMAVEAFMTLEQGILNTVVAAESISVDLQKSLGLDAEGVKQLATAIQTYEGTALKWFANIGDKIMQTLAGVDPAASEKALMSMLDNYDMTLGTFLQALEEGYFDEKTESIKKAITEKFGEIDFNLDLSGDDGGGGGGPDTSGVTNWANKMAEELNKIKQLRIDNGLSDIEFDKQILAKKLEILNQEYNDKATNEDRKTQLETQMADIQLQQQDKAFKEKLQNAQLAYDKEVGEIIKKYSVEGQLTAEGNYMLIQLEAQFLAEKGRLHGEFKNQILGNDLAILQSNENLHAQQMRMAREQVSAVGGIGGALQTLAGDNEKLNGLKEAGIALSQAAAIADAAMTLQTHLQTLGIIQKNVAQTTEIGLNTADAATTNAQTGADLVNTGATLSGTIATIGKTAVDIISIPFKATSAVLTAGMSLPFPLNLVAFAATIFLVSRILKMFSGGGIAGGGGSAAATELKSAGEATVTPFAKGGMVRGKSHAQGGEKFAVGGRVMELEAGEAVINKRSTAMFKDQLSAMNAAGGGVKFADGGLLNMPSFAAASFGALNNSQGGTQKVVVVEADITRTQKKVNVIEAAATI